MQFSAIREPLELHAIGSTCDDHGLVLNNSRSLPSHLLDRGVHKVAKKHCLCKKLTN